MRNNIYLLVWVLLLLVSCATDKKSGNADNILLFDVTKAIKYPMPSSLSPERIINLAFSDSTMIDDNAYLLYDETYFVYSRGSAIAPMHFDKEGNFLNYIGRVGNGPKEYNEIGDVCLNKREKTVEILSGSYVYVYDYEGKYLAEVNLRYDGTSRFRSDNRWKMFPSFSLGWNMAREAFFEPLNDIVSVLKVRASYGSLGNQNTTNWYQTYQTMAVGSANGAWLINGLKPNTAIAPGLVSESLGWETIESYNIGLDWGLFNNRLTGSFDYYIRNTKDMVGKAVVK